MKIGIVTIEDMENYGNRLQNYASQQVIKSLGCEVETLKRSNDNKSIKKNIKNIIVDLYMKNKNINITKINRMSKYKNFEKFTELYIKRSNYELLPNKNNDDIKYKYDYFICGSDQVWNPKFAFNSENDFLTFANKSQRIAYSPSFGVAEIPKEYEGMYEEWINGIEYLSVREKAGANIIKYLTDREAIVLVDPTVMLTKNEWLSISKKPKWKSGKKYVLTYFLGEKSKDVKSKIDKICNDNNLELINLTDNSNKYIYSTDPQEFLWLINNCELMCTDSFHGVVFSLIMKSNFIVFERKDNNLSMNSRIETLLNLFNMNDRLEKNVLNDDIFKTNFKSIDAIIEEEREKAINYLKNALNIK